MVVQNNSIILASESSRRRDMLKDMGIHEFTILVPEIDEAPLKNELPKQLALRLSQEKAFKIQQQHPDKIIIAVDNVVARGRRMLDKPTTDEEVRHHLNMLSGHRHKVYSALTILGPEGKRSTKVSTTTVSMKRLTEQEIAWYIQTQEGIGKAGGYAIQGMAAIFIDWIQGSYPSIVGLDVHHLYSILFGWGYCNLILSTHR